MKQAGFSVFTSQTIQPVSDWYPSRLLIQVVPNKPAAQPAHPADAATRPQDRSDFEGWIRPDSFPDLEGGAADGQAVGRRSLPP